MLELRIVAEMMAQPIWEAAGPQTAVNVLGLC